MGSRPAYRVADLHTSSAPTLALFFVCSCYGKADVAGEVLAGHWKQWRSRRRSRARRPSGCGRRRRRPRPRPAGWTPAERRHDAPSVRRAVRGGRAGSDRPGRAGRGIPAGRRVTGRRGPAASASAAGRRPAGLAREGLKPARRGDRRRAGRRPGRRRAGRAHGACRRRRPGGMGRRVGGGANRDGVGPVGRRRQPAIGRAGSSQLHDAGRSVSLGDVAVATRRRVRLCGSSRAFIHPRHENRDPRIPGGFLSTIPRCPSPWRMLPGINTPRRDVASGRRPRRAGGTALSGRGEIRRVRPPHRRQSPPRLVLHGNDREIDVAQLLLVSRSVGPGQP